MELSHGAIDKILKSEDFHEFPVLQIKDIKAVEHKSDIKYRVFLYDGQKDYNIAMLMGNAAKIGMSITPGSYIRVKRHVVKKNNEQFCIILMDIEVLSDNSQNIDPTSSALGLSYTSRNSTGMISTDNKTTFGTVIPAIRTDNSGTGFPISSLNPFQNRWTIKGKVIQKTDIKVWKKTNSEGKLFSFTIADNDSSIRVTGFKNEVDRFFDLIQVDHVYSVTKGQIKQCDPKYRTTKSEFEITLRDDSEIKEVFDFTPINVKAYNFVSINEILQTKDHFVDVLAVVHHASPVTTVMMKNQNKEIEKRDLTLVDLSKCSIRMTLWGDKTSQVDEGSHPVIVIKDAVVRVYLDVKMLSTSQNSTVLINPIDIDGANRLRGWYEDEGQHLAFQGQSTSMSSYSNTKHSLISQINQSSSSSNEKGDYFMIDGFISAFRESSLVYKACPKEGCNKKMQDRGNNLWMCEKCGEEKQDFTYRMLLSFQLTDCSGSVWVTAFQNIGETILQHTAQEVGDMVDFQKKSELQAMFDKAKLCQCSFKLRARHEVFNDEQRLKLTAMECKPIDYMETIDRMIEYLEIGVGNKI